jgi:CBS domain-containing protein
MAEATDAVDADETVAGLIDRMIGDRRTAFPVTHGGETVGLVRLEDLRGVAAADRGTTRVSSVAREVPQVDADADAFDTLALLGGKGSALVVRDGAVVGTFSQADYSHVLSFTQEFGKALPA